MNRTAGARLAGRVEVDRASWAALWALGRLRLLPFVVALPMAGWGWGHWSRARPMTAPEGMAALALAWALLHLGTMWLNAARDRDEGPVLLGEPGPVPAVAVPMGGVALAAAVLVATEAGAGGLTAVAALLAVAYSRPDAPRAAWKAHPVLGPLTNLVGYGVISPWVGWRLVGVPLDARTLWVLAGWLAGIGGSYLLAQTFQEAEDRARGDRTPVALLGAAATARMARMAFAVSFLLALGLAAAGWLPRALWLAAPWVLRADAALGALMENPTPLAAVTAARRIGEGVAVMGLAAVGDHLAASLGGGPVAGLATAAGHGVPGE